MLRRRLLATIHQRWDHRVTLVIGGPGLGKTTLLAQAVAENGLEPHGIDVWLGLDAGDADGSVAADVLHALGEAQRAGTVSADDIADVVWARSPLDVCLLVDDVHVLPAGSPGHVFLANLVDALPANGHIVLAGRSDPAIPIARVAAAGGVLRITESQLRYDDTEIEEVAAVRGVDSATLAATGGWPAMAELVASAGAGLTDEYLWQEVIEPLGRDRRRTLAAVIELGGGDDALISAALDEPVSLDDALAAIPLIDVDDSGWFRPHDLWRPMARLRLNDAERGAVVHRAISHLVDGRRHDEAFRLVSDREWWDEAPAVLRASCLRLDGHPGAEKLRSWLARCPAPVLATAPAKLAVAVHAALADPDSAAEPLASAIAALRDADDVDGELAAIAHFGRVAWWKQDDTLRAEIGARIRALRDLGHPVAIGIASTGRALNADVRGDDDAALAATDDPVLERVDDAWSVSLGWCRAAAHYARGDLRAAMAAARPFLQSSDGSALVPAIVSIHDQASWYTGQVEGPASEDTVRYDEIGDLLGRHDRTLRAADLSRHCSFAGDLDQAAVHLDAARSSTVDDRPVAAVRYAQAEASLLVAVGDEERAAAILRETIDRVGLDRSSQRRAWRDGMCLTYVLLPEARPTWEASPVVGTWTHSRQLAAAVVETRSAVVDRLVRDVDVSDLRVVRRLLHYRFAAELAVGLATAGRPEGAALLDQLGSPGRAVVRELAGADGRSGRAARDLLAAVPAAPPTAVELSVLGPVQLRRDGAPADVPELRRERVRALLAYLTVRRTASRIDVIAALWPDFDERAGANNLRVTLNHLLGALEPWRSEREPAYFIRADTADLRLIHDPDLTVDLDEFNGHIDAARRAERHGVPSQALSSYLAAVELWRGELFSDVTDQAWLELEREQVRARYAAALVRAAQLLAGRRVDDDVDVAEALARRAIEVDAWAESAYGVLIAAALGRGDRSAAHRLLQRCYLVTQEIGADPSDEIVRLARRVESA